MKFTGFLEVREDFEAARTVGGLSRCVLHDRPVEGLWRSDVGGGAQLAPGPLVISAAASSVAVCFLTERV